jgi:hypothetical protein
MRRQNLTWVSIFVVGSALGWGAWALGQERVKVEVTVPAVPNIGPVTPSQAPSELMVTPRGKVYIGYRGAYHLAGGDAKAMPCSAMPITNSGPPA